MEEKVLELYKSRRNRAALVRSAGAPFVRKTFCDEETFHKELQIYRLLQSTSLPCAKVIRAEERTLLLTKLPGQTLVECLQQQEQAGVICREVWDKLVQWLTDFQRYTGFVMTDVNLRNFLYDAHTQTLYGLDFEECTADSMMLPAGRAAAFIRTYKPENTPIKQEISQYILKLFAKNCRLDADLLFRESVRQEAFLLERRSNRI